MMEKVNLKKPEKNWAGAHNLQKMKKKTPNGNLDERHYTQKSELFCTQKIVYIDKSTYVKREELHR